MGFQVPGTIPGQVAAVMSITPSSGSSISAITGVVNFSFPSITTLGWGVGSAVRITSNVEPLTWYMDGIVTGLTSTTIAIQVSFATGAGTKQSENLTIRLSGVNGVGLPSIVTASSSTSVAIGTGTKTFNYSAIINLGWIVGTRLIMYNSVGNYMVGLINTVTSTQVTVNVDRIVGSGTYASWTISISGDVGPVGPVYTSSLVAAPANAATLTLARSNETFITTSLTNSNSFIIGLSTPASGELNEYIVSFKTGASAPVLTHPGSIKWRVAAPSLGATENWTICYQNIEVSVGVYEVWASAVKAV